MTLSACPLPRRTLIFLSVFILNDPVCLPVCTPTDPVCLPVCTPTDPVCLPVCQLQSPACSRCSLSALNQPFVLNATRKTHTHRMHTHARTHAHAHTHTHTHTADIPTGSCDSLDRISIFFFLYLGMLCLTAFLDPVYKVAGGFFI